MDFEVNEFSLKKDKQLIFSRKSEEIADLTHDKNVESFESDDYELVLVGQDSG